MDRWAQREVHVWYLVMDHFFTVKYSEEGQSWMALWENEPFTIRQRLLSHFLQKKKKEKKKKKRWKSWRKLQGESLNPLRQQWSTNKGICFDCNIIY